MPKPRQAPNHRFDWHPEDVKAAVRKTGISLCDLAVQNGYSAVTITMALRRGSRAVQSLIAAHLGTSPQEIWPSRYDELGQPIDRRRSHLRRNSRNRAATQRKKSEAA